MGKRIQNVKANSGELAAAAVVALIVLINLAWIGFVAWAIYALVTHFTG